MLFIQTLESYNGSGPHPFLQPTNVFLFRGFRAEFLLFWCGKHTRFVEYRY